MNDWTVLTTTSACRQSSRFYFEYDCLIVIRQESYERFLGLVLQFKTINQEQGSAGVARAKEEPDDGGGQSFLRSRSHFEQESGLARFDSGLN